MLFPPCIALIKGDFKIFCEISWCVDDCQVEVNWWYSVLVCAVLILVPPEIAVIGKDVPIFLSDLLICWWLRDWREVKVLCVVMCNYDVVSSWCCDSNEQLCNIFVGWAAILMILMSAVWCEILLLCSVIMLFSFDTAWVWMISRRPLWDVKTSVRCRDLISYKSIVKEIEVKWWSFFCLCDIMMWIPPDNALIKRTF
jgi:hypothetical protein